MQYPKYLAVPFMLCAIAPASATEKLELFEQYLNVQAAIADVDNMDNGVTAVVAYGRVIPEVSKNFAVEGEITTSIIDPERPGTEISYSTFGAYAVYAHAVSASFALRGRAGLSYQDVSVSGSGTSDNDIEFNFSYGATMELVRDMHLVFDYTVMNSDISHISLGVQLRM